MLSITQPDYATIRAALQTSLSSKDSWRDLFPSGTGQTLTDWIAAVGANDSYAIEHAFREAFRSARLDSSILSQAILLGVRIGRKLPASMSVSLVKTGTESLTIPAYTQFSSRSGLLFNRETITLTGTTPLVVQLHEGEVSVNTLTSDGNDYQIYVSPDDSFVISDTDVRVELNGLNLPVTHRGLWKNNGTSGVQDSTSPTGQLLLVFGDDQFGTKPASGDQVVIKYALTRGSLGNDGGATGDSIVVSAYPTVRGTATSGLTNGAEEKSSLFYRKLAPQLFSASNIATTKDEFSAAAAEYPGVYDANVLGQRELSPGDVRWMNLVQVTLLTDTPYSAAEWDEFSAWYIKRIMYPVRLFRRDPSPVTVNVTAKISCQNRADLVSVKSKADEAIRKLFQLRPGLIDSDLYLSDVHAAIRGADATIEYVEITSPARDVIVGVSSPKTLTLTAIPGTGFLPPGQYHYAVTVTTDSGETLATNFKSVVLNATGSIRIDWDEVQLALSYNVYGRTPVELGKLAVRTDRFYIDNGNAPVTGGIPIANAGGHRYPKLGTIDLAVDYTDRTFYDLGNIR